MSALKGEVESLHVGVEHGVMQDVDTLHMEFDGVVGDRFQSHSRVTWAVDKQPKGTVRRNERQWSATSREELDEISAELDLTEALTGGSVSVNLCLKGIPELSRLPKGTLLTFPSGVVLTVVEYNPPCREQGIKIAAQYTTESGTPLTETAFSKVAKLRRGVVGVVDVPGKISIGDSVDVDIYREPKWLKRDAK